MIVRHWPATVAGLTHASSVSSRVRSRLAESRTVTMSPAPLKLSAPPYLPRVRTAPETLPSLSSPERSVATDPLASSKPQAPTRLVDDVSVRPPPPPPGFVGLGESGSGDRKSTRLNSSHSQISYAVFCLKKKSDR